MRRPGTDPDCWSRKSKKSKIITVVVSGLSIAAITVGAFVGANAPSLFGAKLIRLPESVIITVSTYAGSGNKGFLDGNLTSAMFNSPIDLCLDSLGNLYVADANNNRIRKVSTDGVVSTLAGSATAGNVNGNGIAARFMIPMGITSDSNDTLYVADTGSSTIRTVTPSGLVSAFAGAGGPGYTDGPKLNAKFSSPRGIAISNSGNVYVSDNAGHRIRKISTDGTVSTLAGTGVSGYENGPGTTAMFNAPAGLDVDSQENVYVTDIYNHRIRKITRDGIVSTYAGNGGRYVGDGVAEKAEFNSPNSLALDSNGNIIVADLLNNVIRNITNMAVVYTVAGDSTAGFADGSGVKARFDSPSGVAVGRDGAIYVADALNHRIRKIVINF